MSSLVGRTIRHYRILERLGEGAMGVVYRAEDTRLGRIVALKFLPEVGATPEARERLLREARAAARINHPNVCTIYDIHDAGPDQFIVMELVEGITLHRRIGEPSARAALHRNEKTRRCTHPSALPESPERPPRGRGRSSV